jgi:hypothetical protein
MLKPIIGCRSKRGKGMSRFRIVAAVAIFLFGSAFLWFMPSSLGIGITVHGAGGHPALGAGDRGCVRWGGLGHAQGGRVVETAGDW